MTTIYSLPLNQTNLVQYMVEVTTEQGEEYAYYVFQTSDASDHPGDVASQWCNEMNKKTSPAIVLKATL